MAAAVEVGFITCDDCGVDCTALSWFVAKGRSERDFCDKCIGPSGLVGVRQVNGVVAEALVVKPTKKAPAKKAAKKAKV